MTKRVVEHKIKLEQSVKIILGVLAVGVFLNAFAPVFDVRDAFSVREAFAISTYERGSWRHPVRIVMCRNPHDCQ